VMSYRLQVIVFRSKSHKLQKHIEGRREFVPLSNAHRLVVSVF